MDKGLEKTTSCSRANDFLLSGILYGADGSRYYGEAAKSGQYPYYYNRTAAKRFPAQHLHKLVFKRLGELLEQGNLEKLIEKIRCHEVLGAPQFSTKRQRILKELRRLDGVVENFSTAIRENVSKNNDNLIEVIEEMIAEKKRATEEIEKFKKSLHTLDLEEERFRKALRGEKFKRFVDVVLRSIKTAHPLEQKKFLQAVIPKMVIHHGQEGGYYLQLFYNLNPQDSGASSGRRPPIPSELYSFENIISLFDHPKYLDKTRYLKAQKKAPQALRRQEDTFWPSSVNGGRRDIVAELTTTPREVKIMWERPKINLAELAKKHWIDGWSVEQLGDKWGYKRTSINAYLRRLRRGEIESIELEPGYREAIIKEARSEQEEIMEYLKSKGRSKRPRTNKG